MMQLSAEHESLLKGAIPTVADFPIPGIAFKDIAPLLTEPGHLALAIDHLAPPIRELDIDGVLAVESRGFIIGAAVAAQLRCGLVLVRKPGKLPGSRDSYAYTCEYSTGRLEVARGAVKADRRYIVIDDVLATGGTARATANYVAGCGAIVAGYAFLVELTFLHGRERLTDAPILSLIRY